MAYRFEFPEKNLIYSTFTGNYPQSRKKGNQSARCTPG